MALGPRDTGQLVTLTGWDAAELSKYQLQDGTTYAAVVAQMNTALGALNAEIAGDPLYSQLVSYTDEPELEYRIGTSNGFEEFTEYGRADTFRGETAGHMLPLKPYDRRLGWTWNYLRQARTSQLQADIADAIKDARDLWRKNLLARLLKRGDDTGKKAGLGATGISPGFATAAASTGVDYIPPAYGGNAFTVNHEHYVGIAGGLFTGAVFADAASELREHGHEPPYNCIIADADADTVRGLTGFVAAPELTVNYGNATTLAAVNGGSIAPGVRAIGSIKETIIWVVAGVPQYYGFVWKGYGANSQRNPLRIRLQKGQTRPQFIAMPDPLAGNGSHPLQELMLFGEFGVGVADRTNGTARYVNNATWADGVPT
jgi:hypothetical protein